MQTNFVFAFGYLADFGLAASGYVVVPASVVVFAAFVAAAPADAESVAVPAAVAVVVAMLAASFVAVR